MSPFFNTEHNNLGIVDQLIYTSKKADGIFKLSNHIGIYAIILGIYVIKNCYINVRLNTFILNYIARNNLRNSEVRISYRFYWMRLF